MGQFWLSQSKINQLENLCIIYCGGGSVWDTILNPQIYPKCPKIIIIKSEQTKKKKNTGHFGTNVEQSNGKVKNL